MILPDFVIIRVLNNVLDLIRTDYRTLSAANKVQESFLYRITYDMMIEDRYEPFPAAVKMLINTDQDPKKLLVRSAYDTNTNRTPFVFVALGEEHESNNSLTQGIADNPYQMVGEDKYKKFYQRRFAANYQVVIGGENKNEVVLLYHIIKAIVIHYYTVFYCERLEMMKISGGDVRMNTAVPDKIFLQTIILSFEYEQKIPFLVNDDIVKELSFSNKPEGADNFSPPVSTE